MYPPTEKDQIFDSALHQVQSEVEQNKRKRIQGEIDTESLIMERKHEEEDSVSNHTIVGGMLLVLLASMILFGMAKNADMQMYYCLGFSIGTLVIGNIPFLIVWLAKNKDLAFTLLLIIPNVCLICCAGFSGLWHCIFWCNPPPWMRCWKFGGVESTELREENFERPNGILLLGCKRRMDALFCCICQRGLCLGMTPSVCVCTQCHTSCFTSHQRRRRYRARMRQERSKGRRIMVTEHGPDDIEMQEIVPSGEVGGLSTNEKNTIKESIALEHETRKGKKRSSPTFSLRSISSSDKRGLPRRKHISENSEHESLRLSTSESTVLESPRQKTNAWKSMFVTPSV